MPSWGYVFALLIMPNLAIYLQGVRGDMCSAIVNAEEGDDRASMLSKTFSAFRGACRKGQKSQTGKFMAPL